MFAAHLSVMLWSTALFQETYLLSLHKDTLNKDNGTLPLNTNKTDPTQAPTKMPANGNSAVDVGTDSSQLLPSVQSVDNTKSYLKATPATKSITNTTTILDFSGTSGRGISRATLRPTVKLPSSAQHSVQSTSKFITVPTEYFLAPSESTLSKSHSVSGPPDSTTPVPDSSSGPRNSTGPVPDSSSVPSSSTQSSPHFHPRASESSSALTSSGSIPLSTNSTSSTMGILVPNSGRKPKSTTSSKPTPSTIPPKRGGGESEDRNTNPCSSGTQRKDGLVGQCLIAIASLSAVATVFIVTTIALCTKLSSYKHRFRIGKSQGTEMVCISNLLPDGDVPQPRPRHPKSNGALLPSRDDSDGDDLTLNSFLPDNERGL